LFDDSYFSTSSIEKTEAHPILSSRDKTTKEALREALPKKEKPVEEKAEKPVDDAKEAQEYQRYLVKAKKEINTGFKNFDYENSTIEKLSNFIKSEVVKKAVLKGNTTISFIDNKGVERKGEWGKFRHWLNLKANNPTEAKKKLTLKNLKVEIKPEERNFNLSKPDTEGWEKVNYVKKGEEDLLEKFVGGPGSRGGKIIGYTKSGKPIYEDKTTLHKNFTPEDHLEAADLHEHLKAQSLKAKENLDHKISNLPDHKLFTDEHQKLSNQESDAYHNVKKHEAGRAFHLKEGLKSNYINKANEDDFKGDDGWGNNSVVLGRTKSKKEIFNNANSFKHKDFEQEDHKDAYTIHGLEAVKAHEEMGKWIDVGNKDKTDKARDKYTYHSDQYEIHRKAAKTAEKKLKEQEDKKFNNKNKSKEKLKSEQIEKSFESLLSIDNLSKAEFDTKERKKLAKEGEAESGGSYPIRNATDLANAIKALGRSKDIPKTKRWIIKRAKELGKESMFPESWDVIKKTVFNNIN